MENIVYKDMITQEKKHWWFKARREIISNELKKLNLNNNLKVLEIGCGLGGNISTLKQFGEVYAIEMDEFAVSYAKEQTPHVRQGSLPHDFPFQEKFDLICMFDVLEHIEEDDETLSFIKNQLEEDGILFITVPAYQWLYGSHDKLLHHKRRYTQSALIKKIEDKKYQVIKSTYFNSLLFPLVVIARVIDLFSVSKSSIGYKTPNSLLNSIFYTIFRIEKKILNSVNFIFGTSIIIVAKDKKN